MPRSRGPVANLVGITALCYEDPCVVVRRRQEACDMPVSASELEGLNDFRLNPPLRPTMQATSALRISRAASLVSRRSR
jgi:hypothetical protein